MAPSMAPISAQQLTEPISAALVPTAESEQCEQLRAQLDSGRLHMQELERTQSELGAQVEEAQTEKQLLRQRIRDLEQELQKEAQCVRMQDMLMEKERGQASECAQLKTDLHAVQTQLTRSLRHNDVLSASAAEFEAQWGNCEDDKAELAQMRLTNQAGACAVFAASTCSSNCAVVLLQ